jgi:hypothetical protein
MPIMNPTNQPSANTRNQASTEEDEPALGGVTFMTGGGTSVTGSDRADQFLRVELM